MDGVSNSGSADPESYALPLRHTGWARITVRKNYGVDQHEKNIVSQFTPTPHVKLKTRQCIVTHREREWPFLKNLLPYQRFARRLRISKGGKNTAHSSRVDRRYNVPTAKQTRLSKRRYFPRNTKRLTFQTIFSSFLLFGFRAGLRF